MSENKTLTSAAEEKIKEAAYEHFDKDRRHMTRIEAFSIGARYGYELGAQFMQGEMMKDVEGLLTTLRTIKDSLAMVNRDSLDQKIYEISKQALAEFDKKWGKK